jgi:hypothetical protein
MRYRGINALAMLLLVVGIGAVVTSVAWAQTQTQNININATPPMAGVVVDAEGVLHVKTYSDPGGQLARERIASAKASLDPQITAHSKLRKISLGRLEQALRERQGVLTDEMRYLAGLLRVQYVFFYPESKDLVLAGPAEGWMADPTGRVVGILSCRPAVQLQDLVVALRAFPPGGEPTSLIGCSIDPTQDGLAAMQQFLKTIGSRATPADTAQIVAGLQSNLGLQMVSVNGVSPKTHFAQVLVEADYRMKLIGIGLEQPPIRLVSYVDRANPAQTSRNAMERWFFTPDYQCVRVSEDGMAMELVGDGVKLIGESEMVAAGGQRQTASRSSKASQSFVADFTKRYAELADRSPVYAELRNLIDLAITAAYIQQEDYYGKAGWNMDLLGHEENFAVETYTSPKQVASAVNALWKGNRLMTPIGGGVAINATEALDSQNRRSDDSGKLAKARKEVKPELAKGQWWWD